jgi:hypothetical protein
VDPSAGLDDVEKRKFLTLLGLELRPLGRLASSQSLYRLNYPSPFTWIKIDLKSFHGKCEISFLPFPYFPLLLAPVTPLLRYSSHVSNNSLSRRCLITVEYFVVEYLTCVSNICY